MMEGGRTRRPGRPDADQHRNAEPHPPSSQIDLDEHIRVIGDLRSPKVLDAIEAAIAVVIGVYASGGKAIFFGNGGSAADAMHLAAEMLGRFLRERRPVAALALADNHSAVTAIANDYGYNCVFARQIEALASVGDVAIGLSTSGRSANIQRGLEAAGNRSVRTIALTGMDPGAVGAAAEIVVAVPSTETPRVQEAHMLIGHILCDRVERSLSP